MTSIDTKSWRGVHAELLRRITEREWLPGDAVPNETDLATELGCARTTVNRAMRALADAGFLDRRRRAGTRVASHPTSRIVLDIPIIRLEVEQRNAEWRQSLIAQKLCTPPPIVTSRLGLPTHTKMLHVQNLHFADNHPFLFEDRWLNVAALPGVEEADFAAESPNEWLIQNAPYTTGDISFSAINADAALAELLGGDVGAALFAVDRITWNGDVPITSVRLSYAPGYRMNSKI
ncbi:MULTISPECIES: GntR family transcriptional regulator [unclassified Shimia]|uniref:GntR family transcriptional regulator n=1 Tax=unclassified Shimia TaxID=2630038 RepID=UPI0031025F94